jgi:hypothetical protein
MSETPSEDDALKRFEREKADPDSWKQHLKGNFYDEHSDVWETWKETEENPPPRVKSKIEELGVALRPSGETVIDENLPISIPYSIKNRQLLLNLRTLRDGMLVNLLENDECFKYSESRNLWIQILRK